MIYTIRSKYPAIILAEKTQAIYYFVPVRLKKKQNTGQSITILRRSQTRAKNADLLTLET